MSNAFNNANGSLDNATRRDVNIALTSDASDRGELMNNTFDSEWLVLYL